MSKGQKKRERATLFPWCLGPLLVLLSTVHSPLFADFEVNKRKDKVLLVDGKVIECVVVMQSPRGILIIVKDPDSEDGAKQILLPISKVKEVIKGKDEGHIKGFQTDSEQARKVVKSTGYRTSKAKDKAKDKEEKAVVPTGPIKKAKPLIEGEEPVSKDEMGKPIESQIPTKDLVRAYLNRFPLLKETVNAYLESTANLEKLVDKAKAGDMAARELLESYALRLLESQTPKTTEPPKSPKPGNTGPQRRPMPAPPRE